jgi:hypothetical protein
MTPEQVHYGQIDAVYAARQHTLDQAFRKLNGLNPEAYLNDILTRIADGHPINRIAELMPWRIIAAPPASSL